MFSAGTKAALNFHLLVIEGRLGSVVACGDMGNVRGFCELPFLKQASLEVNLPNIKAIIWTWFFLIEPKGIAHIVYFYFLKISL